MKEISEQEMLHRMAAYCSAAERCIQDVEKKLEKSELEQDACERIISRLLKEKFIDEKRYARAFVNDKFRFNHWGKYKIHCELYRKGIKESDIDEALIVLNDDEYDSALKDLLKAKLRSVKAKDGRERYYKLMRFAIGRGFQSSDVSRCLKNLLEEASDYEEDFE